MASVGPEVSVCSALSTTEQLFIPHTPSELPERRPFREGHSPVVECGGSVSPCVFLLVICCLASAECLALCWTGGQLNVQEDAAPRNLNDSCEERCWLCLGVCSCMVQAHFNAQLPFSSGGSKSTTARTYTSSFGVEFARAFRQCSVWTGAALASVSAGCELAAASTVRTLLLTSTTTWIHVQIPFFAPCITVRSVCLQSVWFETLSRQKHRVEKPSPPFCRDGVSPMKTDAEAALSPQW